MAATLDSADPGALVTHTFLSLVHSFGFFFYILDGPWGRESKVISSILPAPFPLPKGPQGKTFPKVQPEVLLTPRR